MGICQTRASGSNYSYDAQAYTHKRTLHKHTQIACLAKSSYLYATVGLLTTEDTLASSSSLPHPPMSTALLLPLFPLWFFLYFPFFFFAELQEALLFSDTGEQFIKQRQHQKLTQTSFFCPFLPENTVCSSSPLILRFSALAQCVFICDCVCMCVCVCKLSTEHKDLQWHQTHSHCVLCLHSPERCSVFRASATPPHPYTHTLTHTQPLSLSHRAPVISKWPQQCQHTQTGYSVDQNMQTTEMYLTLTKMLYWRIQIILSLLTKQKFSLCQGSMNDYISGPV